MRIGLELHGRSPEGAGQAFSDAKRVLGRGHAHLHVGIGRHAADVRAERDARFAVERMRRGHRLDAKLSRPAPATLARADGCEQRRFVDQAAARGVDDQHALLAGRQRLRIDQLRVVGGQRAVQRNGIRLAPDRRQVGALDVGGQILRVRVEAEHAHAHRIGHARKAQADRAEADHADRAAFELDALVRRLVPVAACMRSLSVTTDFAQASSSASACSATAAAFAPTAATTWMPRA
jgi:hypothetical protein